MLFSSYYSFMSRVLFLSIFISLGLCGYSQQEKKNISIHHAVADTVSFVVPEISTQELRKLIAAGSTLLLDTRPHEEWANGHLPGAINVAPKPGMPMSLYTSDVHEILRLVNGNKKRELVLYCNGPFCDKSRRLSEDLIKEGFTKVVRYQLGTPVWQATGNILQVEKEGLVYFNNDQTAVWVDARVEAIYKSETLKDAVNIPFNRLTGNKNTGIIKEAKDDGRLPMYDHNTRIVVFASNVEEAAAVAAAITKEAFHNVHYFNGSYQEVKQILELVEKDSIEASISKFFDGLSEINADKLKAYTTADFMVLESGEVWNMDTLVNKISPLKNSGIQRLNKFEFIRTEQKGNIAWVSYHNTANFSLNDRKRSVHWLESAVLIKENGRWKIKLLHSTTVSR
jgi:rhodanese-related sulfurtransferase